MDEEDSPKARVIRAWGLALHQKDQPCSARREFPLERHLPGLALLERHLLGPLVQVGLRKDLNSSGQHRHGLRVRRTGLFRRRQSRPLEPGKVLICAPQSCPPFAHLSDNSEYLFRNRGSS